jgi:ribosomal protein S18 acetylase RimI-like enzyme
MTLVIRKISKRVYNRFVDNEIKTFFIDDFGKKHGMDHYRTFIFKEKRVLLGAKENGKTIGAISLMISRGTARIGSFAVSKGNRGKGVGTALLDECKRIVKENGCQKIWLLTLPKLPAYQFYKKQGFFEEARLKRHFGGKDLCIMSKFL